MERTPEEQRRRELIALAALISFAMVAAVVVLGRFWGVCVSFAIFFVASWRAVYPIRRLPPC